MDHNQKSSAEMIRDAAEIPKTDSRFRYIPQSIEPNREIRLAKERHSSSTEFDMLN
jgi:hypothetical protein